MLFYIPKFFLPTSRDFAQHRFNIRLSIFVMTPLCIVDFKNEFSKTFSCILSEFDNFYTVSHISIRIDAQISQLKG